MAPIPLNSKGRTHETVQELRNHGFLLQIRVVIKSAGPLINLDPECITRRTMGISRKPLIFSSRGRAKFVELDPYGHVSTQHYLGYFLDHRFIGLRERLGLDLKTLAKQAHLFITRKVSIEYLKPLLADDEFEIRSHVTEFRERTCSVEMRMTAPAGELIARCSLELVCVDRRSQSSTPWPQELIDLFYEDLAK